MRAKAIQTLIHNPSSLKEAIERAVEKWSNWTIVHGPNAFWQPNLFTDEMDALVIASAKPKRG